MMSVVADICQLAMGDDKCQPTSTYRSLGDIIIKYVTFAPTYVDGDMCWSESTHAAADLCRFASIYVDGH